MTREKKERIIAHVVSDVMALAVAMTLITIMVIAGAPTWAWLTAGLVTQVTVAHFVMKEVSHDS